MHIVWSVSLMNEMKLICLLHKQRGWTRSSFVCCLSRCWQPVVFSQFVEIWYQSCFLSHTNKEAGPGLVLFAVCPRSHHPDFYFNWLDFVWVCLPVREARVPPRLICFFVNCQNSIEIAHFSSQKREKNGISVMMRINSCWVEISIKPSLIFGKGFYADTGSATSSWSP